MDTLGDGASDGCELPDMALGFELGSSGRAANALNYCEIYFPESQNPDIRNFGVPGIQLQYQLDKDPPSDYLKIKFRPASQEINVPFHCSSHTRNTVPSERPDSVNSWILFKGIKT